MTLPPADDSIRDSQLEEFHREKVSSELQKLRLPHPMHFSPDTCRSSRWSGLSRGSQSARAHEKINSIYKKYPLSLIKNVYTIDHIFIKGQHNKNLLKVIIFTENPSLDKQICV